MSQPPLDPIYNPSIYVNRSQAEQSIYLELEGDSRFPSVSVIREDYFDRTSAFPGNSAVPPLTSLEIYPKFATLAYVVNASDISPGSEGITTLTTAQTAYGTFNGMQIVTTAVFDGLTASNSSVAGLVNASIPPTVIYGPFTGVAVRSGIVVLYNT